MVISGDPISIQITINQRITRGEGKKWLQTLKNNGASRQRGVKGDRFASCRVIDSLNSLTQRNPICSRVVDQSSNTARISIDKVS